MKVHMPNPITVNDLTFPLYIAHRGGSYIAPENSMQAWRSIASMGGQYCIESDVYKTVDGGLFCMHDGTVTRTSNGTGNASNQTISSVQRLRLDPSSWFQAGYPALEVPTFQQQVAEFGGSSILMPEAKNAGSGALIAAVLTRAGLTRSAVVQAFNTAELAPCVAAGIPSCYLTSSPNAINVADLVTKGIGWVGVNNTINSAKVAELHTAGIKILVWTINQQSERDRLLSMGIDGFFSDDPVYLKNIPSLAADPFATGTYFHGHQAAPRNSASGSNIANPRGTFESGGWSLDTYQQTGSSAFVLQGWGSPAKNNKNCSSYTVKFDMSFLAQSSSNYWASVFVAANSDSPWQDGMGVGTTNPSGYHVLFRYNGTIDIYRHDSDAGVTTKVGTGTAPAFNGTDSRTCQVQVSTQSIFATQGSTKIRVDDTTYRGGYWWFGTCMSKVNFSNVTVA